MDASNNVGRKAQYRERMIEVKVRFHTDHIAEGKGMICPKHAWGVGVARIAPNESHDIRAGKAVHFHSLLEMPRAVEKVLIQHGIRIHPIGPMRKYLQDR